MSRWGGALHPIALPSSLQSIPFTASSTAQGITKCTVGWRLMGIQKMMHYVSANPDTSLFSLTSTALCSLHPTELTYLHRVRKSIDLDVQPIQTDVLSREALTNSSSSIQGSQGHPARTPAPHPPRKQTSQSRPVPTHFLSVHRPIIPRLMAKV